MWGNERGGRGDFFLSDADLDGWAGAVVLAHDAHLSDDKAVTKMGHPGFGLLNGTAGRLDFCRKNKIMGDAHLFGCGWVYQVKLIY
jgi:hypothetical protein